MKRIKVQFGDNKLRGVKPSDVHAWIIDMQAEDLEPNIAEEASSRPSTSTPKHTSSIPRFSTPQSR